jgi:polysaccharide biosynthesis PFTS motif protein
LNYGKSSIQTKKSNIGRFTTGRVYRDHDDLIKKVEHWLANKSPSILGCENSHVKARIIQRIVEKTSEEYTKQFSVRMNTLEKPPTFWRLFDVNGVLSIHLESGTVSVALKEWLKNIFLFVATWFHMLIYLMIALFRNSPVKSLSSTILMEAGGDYRECDDKFVRYCKLGPIAPLSRAKRIIIRSSFKPNKKTDINFRYVAHPLIYLISNYLQRFDRLELLVQHLFAPIIFIRAILACPISILIARDISYLPIVNFLDKKNLIEAIVITNSSFTSQPLWMKGLSDQRFKLHMVWYSQNFLPKIYTGEQRGSNLPSARHMRVDIHWVWTKGFKLYLCSLGQRSHINVVGSILWYLPEVKLTNDDKKLKIAIFDVTPISGHFGTFGAFKNYYSLCTAQKFITDIVDICRRIEEISGKIIIILLKHKRKPKLGFHSSQYLDFIKNTEKNNPNFFLIDNQINLFGLIEKCEISISIPYTSTAYVAAQLKKNTIYYDPFSELRPKYEKNKFIHFASGESELEALLFKHLYNKSHKYLNLKLKDD